jgi:hypothetical protein
MLAIHHIVLSSSKIASGPAIVEGVHPDKKTADGQLTALLTKYAVAGLERENGRWWARSHDRPEEIHYFWIQPVYPSDK